MSIVINIHEAKVGLSKYLHAVEAGETVVLCRRNIPIAEIRAVIADRAITERSLGLAPDAGTPLPASFFEELPAEFLNGFSAG
jgi:antitoxin (DNA-binding transcriptional repressor) of toxin-antitoxin stability system